MTRESEFCYIAERADGQMVMALKVEEKSLPALWTGDPELALRLNRDGRMWLGQRLGGAIGFRKILKG